MYLSLLFKDLRKKRSMNLILLLFIVLVATFIAASVNNLVTVTTAAGHYTEISGFPDVMLIYRQSGDLDMPGKSSSEQSLDALLKGDNVQSYTEFDLPYVSYGDITTQNNTFEDYLNLNMGMVISPLNAVNKIFDGEDRIITSVNDGELYMAAKFMETRGLSAGDRIIINAGGQAFSFTINPCKDIVFGSDFVDLKRVVLSDNDYAEINGSGLNTQRFVNIHAEDSVKFVSDLTKTGFTAMASVDEATVNMLFIMDLVMSCILLIVSVVLVLIAFVLLRFTINFTIDEEFHEIGVMKAIGIPVRKIRTLYLIKYLAIAIAGSLIGLALSVPFGNLMLDRVLQNMVADQGYFWVNILCALLTVGLVILFCFSCTRKIVKLTPIDAVRSGSTGERFTAKGVIKLNKSFLRPVPFMAVNDILGNIKRFGVMIIAFTLGLLLITIPINAANTLNSDYMAELVSMPPGQVALFGGENIAAVAKVAHAAAVEQTTHIKAVLAEQGMPAEVSQEMMLNYRVRYGDTVLVLPAYQGVGDSKADMYAYLDGYPPENVGEIAMTQVSADSFGVKIGDSVMIATGGDEVEKPFIITGTFQTLFQMGVGIRFNEEEILDYSAMFFGHAVNVRFTDNPSGDTVKERMERMESIFPEYSVATPAEYIQTHTGSMNESLGGIIAVIEAVVIFINMLIAVLMIRSFITKEKGEIAVMKAIGFKSRSLVAWQVLRIGIVFAVSGILAAVLSEPLSQLGAGQAFKIMGAGSIHFYIDPFEIYLKWPVIILGMTLLAGIIAALGIYGINPRQTGNIE